MTGIGGAVLALWYGSNKDLANALIFAGGALAVSLIPLGSMPGAFYKLPLEELAVELAGRPAPLWQRIAAMSSGLMIFSGLFLAIFRN